MVSREDWAKKPQSCSQIHCLTLVLRLAVDWPFLHYNEADDTVCMTTFQFFFGLVLSEMILRHTDKTLQSPTLSSTEGHHVNSENTSTMHTDSNFGLFWKKVEMKRMKLDVDEPQLPRRRKVPKRYEHGASAAKYHNSAESLYRQVYFEALDLAINIIKNHFDKPGFKVYSNIEQLVLKASMGKDYESELEFVSNFYGSDFYKLELEAQLKTLYTEKCGTEETTVSSVKAVLQDLHPK